jgi:hypothetical protein
MIISGGKEMSRRGCERGVYEAGMKEVRSCPNLNAQKPTPAAFFQTFCVQVLTFSEPWSVKSF